MMMEGKTEKRRQLVANIESGSYKSNKSNSTVAVVIIASFFLFMLVTMALPALILGNIGGILLLLFMMLFMGMPFALILIIARSNRGADLGKLNPLERWLILYGDEVEADLHSIEQTGNLYTFRCKANYKGADRYFTSRSISVAPIPSEKRKISVFVNPDDPSQYLINIYDRLPIVSDYVLHDRSELKVEPNAVRNPNQSSYIVLIIVICMFVLPFGFFGLLAGIGGVLSGELGLGFTAMFFPMGVAALAIWAIVSATKKQKTVSEIGCSVPATAMKFWVTRSKNSTTYHLSARYIEPSTKIVHEFQTSGPSSMKSLVGTKVKTFINPDNTREYFMDVRGALKELGFTASRDLGK